MRIRSDERGVSAVEFALVFPLLIVLTTGMFYAGIALHRQLSLDHAARDAARHGATLAVDGNGDIADWGDYLDEVIAHTKQAAGGELDDVGTDGRFICVAYVPGQIVEGDPNGTESKVEGDGPDDLPSDGEPCFLDDRSEPRVQIWIGRDSYFDAIFLRTSIALDSTALARYERQP